ncbi:hypothetical protein [Luteolibacter soli]|uniref:DUF3592 domain-containing protein n=1 Tax=Luteolibacter soli TaxID=3135280 RepID=A0ABU9AZM8_9BACT
MSPRPLYRSLSFWSGMLVMIFLSWTWWDSFRHDTWRTGGHFACSNVAGGVSLACYQVNYHGGSGRRDISPGAAPRPAFAAPSFVTSGSSKAYKVPDAFSGLTSSEQLRSMLFFVPSGAYAFLNVPHWILVLAALVPWVSLLAWRWCRLRRLTDARE